jgi:hypothetical protein
VENSSGVCGVMSLLLACERLGNLRPQSQTNQPADRFL